MSTLLPIQEKLISSGDAYIEALLSLIDSAKKTIRIEFYIFESGVWAQKLMKALNEASYRGVNVQLMVDGVGAWNFVDEFEFLVPKNEFFKYKIFHAVPWHFKNYNVSFHWWPSTLFQLFGSLNSRNHRKVCVVDSKRALVGSLNLSDLHSNKVVGERAWFDLAVQVEGQHVRVLERAFDKAWRGWMGYNHFLTWEKIKDTLDLIKYDQFFLLNHSLRLRLKSQKRVMGHIKAARHRIWIMNPYFVPGPRMLRHLKRAAKRGVDVRLFLPRANDVVFMSWVMRNLYYDLIDSGIKIFEYLPSFIHAKSIIVDDWCIVGSSNLNSRSLFHDLEVDYILQTREQKAELARQFLNIETNSEQITALFKTSWLERLLGRAFMLIKYWI